MIRLTQEELAELRVLYEMATPGPWEAEDLSGAGDNGCWQVSEALVVSTSENDYLNGHNARFIAAARTALPQLLDEVQRLRLFVAHIAELRVEAGCNCDCYHHPDGHDEKCWRCLACRIDAVFTRLDEEEGGR